MLPEVAYKGMHQQCGERCSVLATVIAQERMRSSPLCMETRNNREFEACCIGGSTETAHGRGETF